MAAMLLSFAVHWCKGNLGSVLLGTLFWGSPPSKTIRSESTHDRDSLVPVGLVRRRLQHFCATGADKCATSTPFGQPPLPSIQFVELLKEIVFGAPLDRKGYADLTVLSAN